MICCSETVHNTLESLDCECTRRRPTSTYSVEPSSTNHRYRRNRLNGGRSESLRAPFRPTPRFRLLSLPRLSCASPLGLVPPSRLDGPKTGPPSVRRCGPSNPAFSSSVHERNKERKGKQERTPFQRDPLQMLKKDQIREFVHYTSGAAKRKSFICGHLRRSARFLVNESPGEGETWPSSQCVCHGWRENGFWCASHWISTMNRKDSKIFCVGAFELTASVCM